MGEAIRVDLPNNKRKLKVITKRATKQEIEKKEQSKIRVRIPVRFIFFILMTCLTLSLLIMTIMGYNEVSMMNGRIADLNEDISSLEAEHDYLSIQLEPYVSTGRIENLAKTRLKMDYPDETQILALTPKSDVFESTIVRSNEVELENTEGTTSLQASVKEFFISLFR